MIYESFKERVKDKYLYDSGDSESDYEPDDEAREAKRVQFRKRKEEERSKQNKCEVCNFVANSHVGLKIHIGRKHKDQCLLGPVCT